MKFPLIGFCITICLLLPVGNLFAQVPNSSDNDTSAVTPPSSVSVSDKAAELGFNVRKLEEIDKKFSSLLQRDEIVGASALVARKGEEIFYGQWGYQDREKKIPLDRKSIARIYSMTKPVTSVAAMQLVEQGKLDLDAPVRNYLPEFADLKVLDQQQEAGAIVKPRKEMTTRDLMRHTSGLTYGFFGNTDIDKQYQNAGVLVTDINLKATVKKLAKIPLLHHPGDRFHYSVSTDVLGRVIEVVSGEKLDDYFSRNIFEPMGMSDTFFSVPRKKQDRLMQLYAKRRRKGIEVGAWHNSIRFLSENNKFFSGGGGLCSTVDDYLQFCTMLLDGGTCNGKRILGENSIKQMFTNQLSEIGNSPGKQFQFGLGFRCFPEGDFGWGGAAGTKFWVHPKKETAVIYMIQMLPDEGKKYHQIVRDTVYTALGD